MDNKNKYIKVPYEDKDIAKARGAKWDVEKRCWYIPPGKDEALFERWLIPIVRKTPCFSWGI